jgi:putative autotransporter adhesin-like protein
MLRQFGIGATVVLATFSVAAAGEKTFPLTGFEKVEIKEGVRATITSGTGFFVRATGSFGAEDRLQVKLRDGVLSVGQKSKGLLGLSPILNMMSDLEVEIGLPVTRAVSVSSGARAELGGWFKQPLVLSASSGADLEFFGEDVPAMLLNVSSGAEIEAGGSCGTVTLNASSGAEISASDLKCISADASASSGADIDLFARDVVARASSGGDIQVYGAINVTASDSSGGDVLQVN